MWDSEIFLSVLLAAEAALATPIRARTPYSLKEEHPVPKKWSSAGRAPKSHMLHLQIGLKQDRFDDLEKHLHEGKPSLNPPLPDASNCTAMVN